MSQRPATLIDLDEPIPFEVAARLLPGKPHPSTLWRWARHGVDLPGGACRLSFLRMGRRMLTTRRLLDEFMREAGQLDASS